MENERLNMAEFAGKHGINLKYERISYRPDGIEMQGDHYRCVLRKGKKQHTVYFSKGYGHNGAAPTVTEVLNALAVDASSFENHPDLASFMDEFGYEKLSQGKKIYKACERQATKLKDFLGEDEYNELLYETEPE